jgi:hypothetical protein
MMNASGLGEALETVYGPNTVIHMKSGKAFSSLKYPISQLDFEYKLKLSICRISGVTLYQGAPGSKFSKAP